MNDYWQKIDKNPYENLLWNIPEQKQGIINIFGGNAKNCKTEIQIAEFIIQNFSIKEVNNILPSALEKELPKLDNFVFLPSTESGSIKSQKDIKTALDTADFNLILGDFSKNSTTKQDITSACIESEKPKLFTRDSIDLLIDENIEPLLTKNNFFLISMAQLQKLTRAIYYPKVILLSSPIAQIIEVLHKFTISYESTIITVHNNQIIIAKDGKVVTTTIESTIYSPFSIWQGKLASKICINNLFNPNNEFEATISSIF